VSNSGPEPQRQNAPILQIEGLWVSYRSYSTAPLIALRGIDLSIARGEIVGMVGESGAGKTTLARSIMGMVPPPGTIDAGRVRFDGSDITSFAREQLRMLRGRKLAMVVPNPRGELNPLERVGRQVAQVAQVHLGLSKTHAKHAALEIFKAVSIPDPERRYRAYPHELSGGMAQRVVIAMALICSPKFVISDDATSGLDVTVQAQILKLLRTLVHEKNSAMLYITRDMGVAAHFCDRIAILYEGEIVEVADKSVLFADPKHPYTNMLMAAFAQNPELRRQWHRNGPGERAGAGSPENRCSYAPRCVKAQLRCVEAHPELRELRPDRFVRCLYPVER
jgi:oligopeptide/dipeptide ABC transporter ATP-binding protein